MADKYLFIRIKYISFPQIDIHPHISLQYVKCMDKIRE